MQEFTGRHFLLIMLASFGVIIAVNVTMAIYASSSWTGLVVRNSYVAGLDMNRRLRERREQAALGWHASLSGAEGTLRLAIADAEGRPVVLRGGKAEFRRPVSDGEDRTVELAPAPGGALAAGLRLGDGAWIVTIEVDAGRDVPWRESRRILVRNGVVQ